MLKTISRSLLLVPLLWSSMLLSQPMVVIGGSQQARDCFTNAEIAASDLPRVGRSLLEPCDYALEYVSLGLRDRAATLSNRGLVHASLEDFEAAIVDYEAAIGLKEEMPELYINRGNSFFMMREYDRALDDYLLSLELGIDQRHFAHFNMGLTFERLGDDQAAEAEYLQALSLEPGWALPEEKLVRVRERMANAQGDQR